MVFADIIYIYIYGCLANVTKYGLQIPKLRMGLKKDIVLPKILEKN